MSTFNFSSANTFCERFVSGDYDPAGHAAFIEWLLGASEAEVAALLDRFGEEVLQAGDPAFADPVVVAAIEARLDEAGLAGKGRANGIGGRRVWRMVGYGAAAAVVLVLVVGWWMGWLGHRIGADGALAGGSGAGNTIRQDVMPGGDKAVLTLADGRQIVLDSASNGQVAQQGGAQVLKSGGQLRYSGAQGEVVYNNISTPRGGQYQLVLADGTVVWLNSSSSLRFPTAFEGKERVVELTGEGYFAVSASAERPFLVKTGAQVVKVLGTELNIMAYPEEPAVRTTLVTGSIRVEREQAAVVLQPGMQAVWKTGKKGMETVAADMETTLAWKNGHFEFDETDIRTIMRQVERWYDVKVQYQGDVTGVVLSGNISRRRTAGALLGLLAQTKRFHFTIENDLITIMP